MIGQWLKELGLEHYTATFEANGVDLDVLPDLSEAELEQLGIALGHRKRILRAIAELSSHDPKAVRLPPPENDRTPAPGALRRHLTVMFCDLVASTALSVKLDPEDFSEVVRGVQNACKAAVLDHGGSIGQYQGDGVLAYFGYPQAHENDAERAARAGLEVVARIKRMRLPSGENLRVRVGIATGVVVVGDGTGSEPGQQQVFGETPNLASRLQGLALPNTVVVSDATRRLLSTLFVCEDMGARGVQGLPGEVPIWQVVAQRNVESRFEATHSAQITPLVGRREELDKLLELWSHAKGGAGRIAMLCGEAGIGKSRISAAMIKAIADEPHVVMRYQCSPHHVNSPFYPLITQLAHAARLEEHEPPGIKLDKLETLLRAVNASQTDLALNAALLSIPTGTRYPALGLTPQRQKERTIAALISQLLGVSRALPVLALFEDLHWVDPSTHEVLNRAIDAIRTAPVLLIATFRPEFFPLWLDQSHATMVHLNRLTREQTAAMLTDITRGKALPPEVFEQIQSKTDGVPLFVEELTKAVLESGLLQEEEDRFVALAPLHSLAIPTTLQDSLTARLDRLAPVREIAQIGAVLGRQFPHKLIAAVAAVPTHRLLAALSQLTAAELIFRRGDPPEAVYTFKHALVQDAAYESLLRSKRQSLHARVASVLVRTFPDIIETQPELIAHHLARSGQVEPAIDYMLRAGRRAIQRSANAEAIGQLQQALELLQTLSEGPDRAAKALTLEVTLGQAMIASFGYAASTTKEVLLHARTHINDTTEPGQKFAVLYGIWACYYVGSDVSMQREVASEFLIQAERHGDPGILCIAHRILGSTLVTMGEFAIARMHLEKARALYDPEKHADLRYEFGQDIGAAALCYLSWVLWHTGHYEDGLRVASEGVARAVTLSHPHTFAYTICHARGLMDVFRGTPDDTRAYAATVIALCDEHGFPFWGAGGRILAGWAATRQGQEDEGIELLRAGIAAWRKTGARLWLSLFLTLEAEAHANAGRASAARQTIEEALAIADETGEAWAIPEVLRIKAAIIRSIGDGNERDAEVILRQALGVARAKQSRWWELCIACDLAELWRAQSRTAEATELLQTILGRFTDLALAPNLRRAATLLQEMTRSAAGTVESAGV
jgi:class 3 adenylate cyclase/predicted ATPase